MKNLLFALVAACAVAGCGGEPERESQIGARVVVIKGHVYFAGVGYLTHAEHCPCKADKDAR